MPGPYRSIYKPVGASTGEEPIGEVVEDIKRMQSRADARIDDLLRRVKSAGEDYEFYPTTSRMVAVVARHLDKSAHSLMDIGAGDGRVLTQLAAHFEPNTGALELYAIEKSQVLVQAQPAEVIPVGTELFEQNLACLPVDYIFSNPPYSQYEAWACLIIETGHARKAFLVIPQRWVDSEAVARSIKSRGARVRVIHSDDFHDGVRPARAVVDIVEISYPTGKWGGGGLKDVEDPFDRWFDQNIDTFKVEEEAERLRHERADYEIRREELAKIRHLRTIEDLVAAYGEEYARMEENYRAIFRLDAALLRELGVSKENVRDGIKKKMAGLKSKYWTILFERLDAITNRLSTATKKSFLEKLLGRSAQAFTSTNAYAVVLWSIKNANRYFNVQTVQLYKDLSTFEGVFRYKSNVRTWDRNGWRYAVRNAHENGGGPSHYALDYRIVLEGYRGIGSGYEYHGGLHRDRHEIIADVVAVMFNLGFPSHNIGCASSTGREWVAGKWQDWHRLETDDNGEMIVLFQVKAHANGNMHFRFMPGAIMALNIEAGRLLGWIKGTREAVKELGCSEDEAERWYGGTRLILPESGRKLLGMGEAEEVEEGGDGGVDRSADGRKAALLRARAKRAKGDVK